jgi:chromate transport protein ChrA
MPFLDPDPAQATPPRPPRPLGEVGAVMGKLGTIAFGGPAVHVAMLRDETVRRRHWLADAEFLDLFGAVSVLPGPSSTQLAIVLSRRRAGWAGLVLGGACFVLPAMAIVLALAWAYVRYGSTPTGGGVLYGVGPVVIALVVVAVWELAHSSVARHREQGWLAMAGLAAVGVAALAAYLAGVNVLAILATAGLLVSLGWAGRQACRTAPPPPGRQHPGVDPGRGTGRTIARRPARAGRQVAALAPRDHPRSRLRSPAHGQDRNSTPAPNAVTSGPSVRALTTQTRLGGPARLRRRARRGWHWDHVALESGPRRSPGSVAAG